MGNKGSRRPEKRCTLPRETDLHAVLDETAIENLDVDEHRTVVIYQSAILILEVVDGQSTEVETFDVEFWKEPPDENARTPEEYLTSFIEEIGANVQSNSE